MNDDRVDHRQRLLARIGDLSISGTALPMVTLEEFFEGNCYLESIVHESNVRYQPQTLYSIFRQFREIDGIHDVLVEVSEMGRPDRWPISDTFWVIAEFDPRHYREQWPAEIWDRNLPCDFLTYPRKDERSTELIAIPDGMIARGMQYYNLKD